METTTKKFIYYILGFLIVLLSIFIFNQINITNNNNKTNDSDIIDNIYNTYYSQLNQAPDYKIFYEGDLIDENFEGIAKKFIKQVGNNSWIF